MYEANILSEKEGADLLRIARTTLEKLARHEHVANPSSYSEKLNDVGGVVCTLYRNGDVRSRSAVGLPYPLLSTIDAVMAAVMAAAQEKNPVTADELMEIKIEIALTTEPKLLDYVHPAEKYFSVLIPEADGVVLKYGVYESFLLPADWGKYGNKEDFLDRLCMLAGLTKGMWREDGVELYRFHAQVFRD